MAHGIGRVEQYCAGVVGFALIVEGTFNGFLEAYVRQHRQHDPRASRRLFLFGEGPRPTGFTVAEIFTI